MNINLFLKRVFDILASFLLIIILLPSFIIIGIVIKCDSKGPVFYKQKRLTKNRNVFLMYKFRTMIHNAENIGTGLYNYKDDFRVTVIGKYLRKLSIDELPQLINILKGEMSFVGPRPPVEYELGDIEKLSNLYKNRFKMKAGITGLAQINGRNEISWDEKVVFDNQYINLFQKDGLLIDFKIILITLWKVLTMRNIYEQEK